MSDPSALDAPPDDEPGRTDHPGPLFVVAVATPPSSLYGARVMMGVLPHRGPDPRVTLLAKATLSYAPRAGDDPANTPARFTTRPLPPRLDEESLLGGADERELRYASDFVPRKAAVDVLLTGHAHAPEDTTKVRCAIRIGSWQREFVAASADAARAIALSAANIRSTDGSEPTPVGPRRVELPEPLVLGMQHDDTSLQAAPLAQRLPSLAPDAVIELHGLSRHGVRRITLPGAMAVAVAEGAVWQERQVPMRIDTLWLDTDAEELVVVWRGSVEVMRDGSEIFRFVTSLERHDAPREPAEWRRGLHRGRFRFAHTRDGAPRTDPDHPAIRAARYASWLEQAPEPAMSLTEYAATSAALIETRDNDRRRELLRDRGLGEEAWVVEERAWMEKLARAAMNGDARLAADYSVAFLAAQQALGGGDRDVELDEYAKIRAAMELGGHPAATLERFDLTIPAYMRLDRRWRAEADDDEEVADELEAALERWRAHEREQAEARQAARDAEEAAGDDEGDDGDDGEDDEDDESDS